MSIGMNLDAALKDLEAAIADTPLDQSPGATPHPPPPRSQRYFRDAAGRISRIEVTYADGTVVTKHIVRNADHQVVASHETTEGTGTVGKRAAEPDDLLVGLRKESAALRSEDARRKGEATAKFIFKHRGYLTELGVSWFDLARAHTGRMSVEEIAALTVKTATARVAMAKSVQSAQARENAVLTQLVFTHHESLPVDLDAKTTWEGLLRALRDAGRGR